eukprot:gene9076-1631_t
MKLDCSILRYLENEDLRVLTATEMGMRNHELVPTCLIEKLSGLKFGGTRKILRKMLQHKLLQSPNIRFVNQAQPPHPPGAGYLQLPGPPSPYPPIMQTALPVAYFDLYRLTYIGYDCLSLCALA